MGIFGPPNIEKLKDKKYVPGLIKALGYQKNEAIRQEAANALGEMGDITAVNPLLIAFEDKNETVGNNAAEALLKILIRSLSHENEEVRRYAVKALGKIGDSRAVEPLICALKDPDQGVRKNTMEALGMIGDAEIVRPLIRALLRAQDPVELNFGENALRNIKNPSAVGPLIKALKYKNKYVRALAAESLGNLGDPKAVRPLIRALKDDDDNVRSSAAAALKDISDPGSVEPLIETLNDEDNNVRTSAAWALGVIGDPRAVDPLGNALLDRDWHVRESAVEALRLINDPRAVELLIDLLNNSSMNNLAFNALNMIASASMVEPLIRAYKDQNMQAHSYLADLLGRIGDPKAIKPLIKILGSENYFARLKAAEALGRISDPKVEEALLKALEDEANIKFTEAEVLKLIDDPNAVEWLNTTSDDED
ncbi:HEAT repeat domain-containing protein [bacterium]|nr:HEAT repeat domain-containing protein [bacterium]